MSKKKKKKNTKSSSGPSVSGSNVSIDNFQSDPLVEGDCKEFSISRVFTVGSTTIQYTFREHYLYFPWENKRSKFYSTDCPPGSYHLEKRNDLKHFDFFSFIKNTKSIRLYRFALENKLCDDLLEYVSDQIESQSISLFRQKIEELRNSKQLTIKTELQNQIADQPFVAPIIDKSDCHYLSIRKVPTDDDLKRTQFSDPNLDRFLNWFNNLNDPFVTEVTLAEPFTCIALHSKIVEVDEKKFSLNILQTEDHMLRLESIEDLSCIRLLVRSLIDEYHRRFNTKFKFVLASAPGSGKTYVKHLFSGYNILDLDDISMLDPNEQKKFHSLIEMRDWSKMKSEYCRVINTRFREGILLAQNSNQVPKDIPYITIVTPGHLGEKKKWSDRGLYDLVIHGKMKVFVANFEFRNKLVQIVYEELFNSLNYF